MQTVYCQYDTLSRDDRLSAGQLPEQLLDGIRAYALSVGGDCIQAIFLLQKTVTDEKSVIALVIQFQAGSEQEAQSALWEKLTDYLDACDSRLFTIFDYEAVKSVQVYSIPGSCIYHRDEVQE